MGDLQSPHIHAIKTEQGFIIPVLYIQQKRSFTSLHRQSRLDRKSDYKTYDETKTYAIKRTNITATHFNHKIVWR